MTETAKRAGNPPARAPRKAAKPKIVDPGTGVEDVDPFEAPAAPSAPEAESDLSNVDTDDPSMSLDFAALNADAEDDEDPAEPEPEAEASPEELALSAQYGLSVGQLRQLLGQANTELDEAAKAYRIQEHGPGAICGACWPDGWPNDHAHSANCEHGSWSR